MVTIFKDNKEATKIVEFWDLAGDVKYMKTTVYGLTSSSPDVVMLIISGNKDAVFYRRDQTSVQNLTL